MRIGSSNSGLTLKALQVLAQRSTVPGQKAGRTGPADQTSDTLLRVHALLDKIRRVVADGPVQNTEHALERLAELFPAAPRTKTVSSTLVTGANAAQVAATSVQGLPAGSQFVIQGEVRQAARAARLTVTGGSGATATAGGTYTLSGNRGSMTLDLEAGESLYDVAARINQESSATGVTASIESNNLVLTTSDVGQAATVQLEPLDIETIDVTGVNADQIDDFQVDSFTPGATETITGSVVSTAGGAELIYRGGAGSTANGTATFQLTGVRGAAAVTINAGEALSAVAGRINQQTAFTGVVATVDGNDLRLTSDTVGDSALVRVDSVALDHDPVVTGVNAAQVSDFDVVSQTNGSQHVLSGQVTRTASKAAVTLQGSGSATVVDSATFELSGSQGAATISITQGESLSAVASRVNAATASTGVAATVSGNQLVFESIGLGSSAEVNVELIDVTHTNVVTGVNSQQLTSFAVDQFTQGATHAISGSITQTAGQAELSHTGSLGLVGQTATFTLSGSLGSVEISTNALQSLNTLASNVNQHTATTGVTAVVQGQQIKFRSTGVGSSATVGIDVTSGAFSVAGGNGNGTANGTNAVAVVNGQTISGNGNQFQFTDALGTYSFTAASGFTGAFNTVSIESQAGSFELSGGNGDGTAIGLDALATINSVALTGVGNRFTVNAAGGQFELEFAAGFVGTFDNITVQSTPDTFVIDGGDGAGNATGADAVAIINGVQRTSSNNGYTVVGTHGTYEIQFAAGFEGSFNAVRVESTAVPLVTDAGEDGLAFGDDIETIVNGQEYTGSGSRVQVSHGGLQITLDFQSGFAGQFDPITATQLTQTVTDYTGVLPPQGESEQSAAEDPLADLRQEINELIVSSKIEPLRGVGMESARLLDPPSQADIVAKLFNEIFNQGQLQSSSTFSSPQAVNPRLLRAALDLFA